MSKAVAKTKQQLLHEIEDLQAQLAEAQETLRAIRQGEVDAIIVSGAAGEQVFSLVGAESIYRLIVETMKEAAFTVALDGRILYCNAQFENLIQRPAEQTVGHSLQEFVVPEHRDAAEFLLITSRVQPVKQRLVFQNAEGAPVPAHVSSNAINQPDGLSICIVAADLTELENSTAVLEQLRRALGEAEDGKRLLREASRRKDEFLAMLAHELRNPLAAISNGVELLARCGADKPESEHARSVAVRQVAHMVRLVNDLLDVSRVTQGKIRLRKEPISVASAIEDAIQRIRPLIGTRGHRLLVSLPDVPMFLDADPLRLTQVFSNLLDNAARYTPAGGEICVSAMRDGDEAVILVRDNGFGIQPDLLPHIFEAFVQAERSLAREQGGLGIGLTMVRSVVEMHGGRVEAHSDGPGKGSEFAIRLPLPIVRQALAQGGENAEGEPVARRRILLVDGNVDVAETMAALLENEGHEVALALSGTAALDIAVRNPPEIAFIDIEMPAMESFELVRRLRKEPALARTVFVALTGYGRSEDLQQAGFAQHLVKPVELEALRRVLNPDYSRK